MVTGEFGIYDCFIDNFENKLNRRLAQQGVILKSLKSRGLHEKHAVATWNLGTISAFALRQRKTKKTCVEMAGRRTFRMRTDY
jgi:hypothetical protein